MFDVRKGEKVARRLYDQIIDIYGGEPLGWVVDSATAIAVNTESDDELSLSADDLRNLAAWVLDEMDVDDLALLLMGEYSFAKYLGAALEAEHEFGWGLE